MQPESKTYHDYERTYLSCCGDERCGFQPHCCDSILLAPQWGTAAAPADVAGASARAVTLDSVETRDLRKMEVGGVGKSLADLERLACAQRQIRFAAAVATVTAAVSVAVVVAVVVLANAAAAVVASDVAVADLDEPDCY